METSFNRKSKNKHRSKYSLIGCLWMLLPLFGFVFFQGFINIRDISSYFDRNISKNFKYKKKYNEAKKNGSSVFFSSIDGPINSKVKIFYDSFNMNGICKIINIGSFKILNNKDLLMESGKSSGLNRNLEDKIFIKYRLDMGPIKVTRPNTYFKLYKDSIGFPIPVEKKRIFEFIITNGNQRFDLKMYIKFDWHLFGKSKNVFVRYGMEDELVGSRTHEFSPKTINQIVEHFEFCEGKIKM